MKTLDLHGYFHEEVYDLVENFVLMNYEQIPLKIITGLSDKMKNIVEEVLTSHNFIYKIPSHNPGEIIVMGDND